MLSLSYFLRILIYLKWNVLYVSMNWMEIYLCHCPVFCLGQWLLVLQIPADEGAPRPRQDPHIFLAAA